MADLSKIIKISRADYNTIAGGGSITKGGVTYTYDNTALYLVDDGIDFVTSAQVSNMLTAALQGYVALSGTQIIRGQKRFNNSYGTEFGDDELGTSGWLKLWDANSGGWINLTADDGVFSIWNSDNNGISFDYLNGVISTIGNNYSFPSTGGTFALTKQLPGVLMSPTSVAGATQLSARWYISGVNGVTTPYDGMIIAVKIPTNIGGSTAGTVLSINGNTNNQYHPVVYNVNTKLSSYYSAGSVKFLVYDANASVAAYITSGTLTTITGVWKMDADYNTDTNTMMNQYYAGTSSYNNNYPLLMSRTAGITSTSNRGATYANLCNTIYANPYTGTIYTNNISSSAGQILRLTGHNSNSYGTISMDAEQVHIYGHIDSEPVHIMMSPDNGGEYDQFAYIEFDGGSINFKFDFI